MVVAVAWGTDLIQFLAAIAFLYQDDLKNEMNSSFSSYRPVCNLSCSYCPGAIHPFLQIVLVQKS